jgi:CRP/FNR family transcriptional regulator, dissimilatory nitrate respiration regulator
VEIVRHISGISLFEGLPPEQHRDLATVALEKSFKRGTTIFSEGDPGTGFFILLTGRVKIFKLSAEGKEQILHIFGPGEPFGEVPVFEGRRFPAHAMALEDSSMLFLPRAGFIDLIKRNPSLALSMLAVLSRRLRRFTVMVDNLSLKEVPGRLAAHLLYLSEQAAGTDTVELDIPKGQLAALLGTIPETFSRILKKMVQQGFIRVDGAHIAILDREGLTDLAEGAKRL